MTFPTAGLLDNFNRADANPPGTSSSGAAWGTTDVAGSTNTLRVLSNQLGGSSPSQSAFIDVAYGPDMEASAVMSTLINSGSYAVIYIRTTTGGAFSGYYVEIDRSGSTFTWGLFKWSGGASTQFGTGVTQSISAGDSFGIDVVGQTLTAYYKPAAGSWTSVLSRTADGTITSSGRIAFELGDSTVRLDDVVGGTVVAGDASVTSPPLDGTGAFPPPVVTGSSGATVTAVPGAGTGDFPSSQMDISETVTSGPFSGTGAFPAPVVSTASPDASVTAVPADGTGVLPPPSFAAGSSLTDVPADGTGDFPSPGVSDGTTTPYQLLCYRSMQGVGG